MASVINNLNNNQLKLNQQKIAPAFKGANDYLFRSLTGASKPLDSFLKMQEDLSVTRCVQDTATNWAPKALFSRGKVDFGDMTFLEILEDFFFYFAPGLMGENVMRKGIASKFLKKEADKGLDEHLSKSVKEIVKDENLVKSGATKKLVPLKGAIILGCACIPAAEYALSFAKNLFTLKVFKKADFNNVANLQKNQVESKEHQDFVEKSAKKHLKNAAIISGAGLGASVALASAGQKSKLIRKGIEVLLEPGETIADKLTKAGHNSKKADRFKEFLKTYLKFDFNNTKGKMTLSKGQLAIITTSGLFGYSAAAKDRGPLDYKEVWSRVPLVVFYTVFGSSIFDGAFKHILHKNNKFSDLIKENKIGSLVVPSREELPDLAADVAKNKKLKGVETTAEKELKRLVKEKSIISGVPYLFSLVTMGFVLSGINRFWTQKRFDKSQEENKANKAQSFITSIKNTPKIFNAFTK